MKCHVFCIVRHVVSPRPDSSHTVLAEYFLHTMCVSPGVRASRRGLGRKISGTRDVRWHLQLPAMAQSRLCVPWPALDDLSRSPGGARLVLWGVAMLVAQGMKTFVFWGSRTSDETGLGPVGQPSAAYRHGGDCRSITTVDLSILTPNVARLKIESQRKIQLWSTSKGNDAG